MPEIDDKKPEPQKPKQKSDDSVSHTLSVFAQSLAYTAVEAPLRGAAQIVDHASPFATKLDETIQAKFDRLGVHKVDDSKLSGHAWAAANLGSAIGMVLPMKLSRTLMVGKSEQSLGHFLSADTHLADQALREARLSAKTGLFYSTVLTPTDNQDGSGNFFIDRAKQGLKGAATFGAMGYTSAFTSGVLGKTAAAFEHAAAPIKYPLQTALHSDLVHGAIGGVTGGLVQAQVNAMENGKFTATREEFKDSVISMTMAGGVMGSAGLFKEAKAPEAKLFSAEPPKPLVDNISALRFDTARHADVTEPLAKSAKQFDIKFDPIEKAWKQEEVDKYKTSEKRSIEFAATDREKTALTANWEQFAYWGIESRQVPVDVYKFPGIKAEIIVPSEYARILDRVREQRLNPDATQTDLDPKYHNRVLPEELAQVFRQLPNSDLIRGAQLLDHRNPGDMKSTRDKQIELAQQGTPNPDYQHVALANAAIDDQIIRVFPSSTNDPVEMFNTSAHEWSHLAEGSTVYNAFAEAAYAERNGFYYRNYARQDDHENWAVHLGERFLNAEGGAFAELPEKAPARTLVMASALRQTLEARAGNPSPRHQEFLARVDAAENVATKKLQDGILADIKSGDTQALDEKLNFLHTAVSSARSAQIFNRVLQPIDSDLVPVLEARPFDDKIANQILSSRLANQLAENYEPEKIPEYAMRWRNLDTIRDRIRLFSALPEAGQRALSQQLVDNPAIGTYDALTMLEMQSEGSTQKAIAQAIHSAQTKFEQQGIALSRDNQIIPDELTRWMWESNEPEARLAVLKNRGYLGTTKTFGTAIAKLSPSGIHELITDDVMAYVDNNFKAQSWHTALSKLTQADQVQLFRSLAQRQDPAYSHIASQIEGMSATEFAKQSENIEKSSLQILTARETTPEFILAHPLRIKSADDFFEAAKSLTPAQTESLIENGGLRRLTGLQMENVQKTISGWSDIPVRTRLLSAIEADRPYTAPEVSSRPFAYSESVGAPRQPKEFFVRDTDSFARARALDLKIDPIENAWSQDEVDKYRTSETRKIEFAREGRESEAADADWKKFHKWGVEEHEVPVDVYRFPGVNAEIVVPSDYARKLDEARARRLKPPSFEDYNPYASMAANDNYLPGEKSVLPEELAQIIKQLPHPDLAKRYDLLEHADPWDMKNTHDRQAKAEAAGKPIGSQHTFVANGAADQQAGRIILYRTATNDPTHMQWLNAHEWSHLAENDVAFKAFKAAARIERRGYFSRDYARTNLSENWAVHMGEDFLNPKGLNFAVLVHEAPARTLVLAKAARNMLEARKDNPSPKQAELLARIDAAEDIATRLLQDSIRKDIEKGNTNALDNKLKFLNVAASEADSPEFLRNVLGPIDNEIRPLLTSRAADDTVATETLERLSRLSHLQ